MTTLASKETKQEMSDRLGKVAAQMNKTGSYGRTMFTNGRHPIAFLRRLDAVFSKRDHLAFGVARQLGAGRTENQINQFIHFYPLLGVEDYDRSSALILSAYSYPQFPAAGDLRKLDLNYQRFFISLLQVADAVDRYADSCDYTARHRLLEGAPYLARNTAPRLKDGELIELVVEHFEHGGRIVRIIDDHRTVDPAVIRGILNGTPPSLAIGHL